MLTLEQKIEQHIEGRILEALFRNWTISNICLAFDPIFANLNHLKETAEYEFDALVYYPSRSEDFQTVQNLLDYLCTWINYEMHGESSLQVPEEKKPTISQI